MKKNVILFLVVLATSLLMRNQNVNAQVAEQDSLALVALYNSTNGPGWTNSTNWLTGPVSTWFGVTVSGGRVTEIDFPGNNLAGPIPPEIGNLTNLTFLQLSVNPLSGSIPPELGNLTNLTILNLNDNSLSGSIPPEIGNLTNLRALFLDNNQLDGALPPELGNLTNLSQLVLLANEFSGAIPPEIGNLTDLQFLWLHFNDLSGSVPPEIANLNNLIDLRLHNNKLVDLPDLSNLPLLTLSIENNRLTFEDIEPNLGVSSFTYSPQEPVGTEENRIVTLNSPMTVSVSVGGANNQYQWLKDGVEIAAATESSYTIDAVKVEDAGDYTCKITNTDATDLTLVSRPIHVAVDIAVADQDSLALVALYNSTNGANWTDNTNWLTGPVHTWAGVISVSGGRVTSINIREEGLEGTIPAEIGDLSNLIDLMLEENELSGAIPAEIGNLTNLTVLNLADNQLSGEIPAEIGNLSNLISLQLERNQLSGAIPPEIGNLVNLTDLTLRSNQLSGAIPAEIGNLTNLTVLNLADNQLSGAIPAEIGNLSNLISLQLERNQLSGAIPPEIGNLVNLADLTLWSNQLSGAVPGEIVNLNNLPSLVLSNNQLVDLPDLSAMSPLSFLLIDNNRFTFEDIEPNIGVAASFFYSPQDPVGTEENRAVNLNSPMTVSVTVGGENNLYKWLKDGVEIAGATENSYTIAAVELSDGGDYTCEIKNTVAMALTLVSRPVHVSVDIAVAEQDSLALVALYNSTNGPTWDNNSNWLTEEPISAPWHGVTVSGGQVATLDLNNNNLGGAIPAEIGNLTSLTSLILRENQLSGVIPAEIGNLTNLTILNLNDNSLSGAAPAEIVNLTKLESLVLSQNQLVGLPDLSTITSLSRLWIEDNRFTFEDIEPNIGVSDFTYSPQGPVGTEEDKAVTLNSPLTVSVSVGGENNQYQWLKDGVTIPGATESSYGIDAVELSDAGDYTCEITNTVAMALTLASQPIHVTVDTPPLVVTNASSDLTPASATLHGTVNPNGLETTVKFEYGITTAYGSEITATESPVTGTGVATVSAALADLIPNATYHYRVVATNRTGTTNGADQAFTTPLPAYPSTLSINTSVNFAARSNASDYQAADYRIVGIPGNGNQPVQSFLTGRQNRDWQVYWDNGAASDFKVLFDGSATFQFSTGRAFWVVNKGLLNIATSVTSAPLSASQELEIPLRSGWNLITNPFTSSVTWASVQTANSTPDPLTDPIWAFNGSFAQSASFDPNTGYYFFNTNGLSLLKVPYALYFPGAPAAPSAVPLTWRVKIALSSGEFSESATSFGISQEASAALDALDFRKPRALGAIPGVAFQRAEWDADYSLFASDIRPEFDETETWTFEVLTQGRIATLVFSGITAIPPDYELYLIHDASGEFIDLSADSVYRFSPKRDLTGFRVVAGEENAVQEYLASVMPEEFQLGQNYPNPFNPTTKIPVALPVDSEIELKVYNILGREVATIFSGQIQAGRHLFEWNGRNSAGNRLSSGVYFYRLTAGKKAALAGKMIMLK